MNTCDADGAGAADDVDAVGGADANAGGDGDVDNDDVRDDNGVSQVLYKLLRMQILHSRTSGAEQIKKLFSYSSDFKLLVLN